MTREEVIAEFDLLEAEGLKRIEGPDYTAILDDLVARSGVDRKIICDWIVAATVADPN